MEAQKLHKYYSIINANFRPSILEGNYGKK
jgi:hypothetical protein